MTSPIIKRLHVSGLTPALTPTDLSQRLSNFGTVKALDGFGLVDGVGQPRKFGYVTIETTEAGLKKCLNVLSGSIYKGAKLRIGEAKPDFRERLAKEREQAASEYPRKNTKRRKYGGVHAPDMSLVTPENIGEPGKGGWKLMSTGRLVRSVRMRPDRPLVLARDLAGRVGEKRKIDKNGKVKKARRREKVQLSRARRRTIDMTKWGSVHLKGAFLDVVTGPRRTGGDGKVMELQKNDEESDNEGLTDGNDSDPMADSEIEVELSVSPANDLVMSANPNSVAKSSSAPMQTADDDLDMTLEKTKSLGILKSLFGDRDDSEWVDNESISDIDDDRSERGAVAQGSRGDLDMEVEEVRMEPERPRTIMSDLEAENLESQQPYEMEAQSSAATQATQATKLKDLFAPRDEDSGFSLLGHLDLDLELDDEVVIPVASGVKSKQSLERSTSSLPAEGISATIPMPATAPFIPDSRQPFFFPHNPNSKTKDLFSVASERGWNWRDPTVGFYRTETDDEIRKRWEDGKVELTREWKRRCREAGKVRRRKGGIDGD